MQFCESSFILNLLSVSFGFLWSLLDISISF
jgi:hypothetical protein